MEQSKSKCTTMQQQRSGTKRKAPPPPPPPYADDNNPDNEIDPAHDVPAARLAKVRHELGQHRGVNISIEVSDTFAFNTPTEMTAALEGYLTHDEGIYVYSRSFNPTVESLGRYMAALECTESAYCTSSGMSAITATIMHLCKHGGHVVAAETLYEGAHHLLKTFLPDKCNIHTTFVDITDHYAVENAIKYNKPSVLYFETVANPALIVADIPKLSEIAHKYGVQVVVDNTFTQFVVSPIKHGADVVVHSLTKYVSGGADIIAGAICGTHKLINDITNFEGGALMMLGPVMNPKEAFELLGRMAHTGIRVKKQCNRALKLATKMKELGINVNYPGLPDHPDHQILDKMRNKGYGFGAVVCIDMGTNEKAYSLLSSLNKHQFGFLAVSLGYYEILMSCPGATSSDKAKTLSTKRAHIVTKGYIRFCIGYMGTFPQKWKQFKDAYDSMDKIDGSFP